MGPDVVGVRPQHGRFWEAMSPTHFAFPTEDADPAATGLNKPIVDANPVTRSLTRQETARNRQSAGKAAGQVGQKGVL